MAGPNVHYVRTDIVSRKRDERMIREAYRREKKISSYLEDDENFPSFRNQLVKIGLELRDIPGDGNCLFRALGDQYEGHVRNHFRHRQDVVKYMMEHKDDFEPFLAEDTTFDKHVQNLQRLGTYAGNDAIVAFARLHQVNIVIHQLNSPYLLIQGPSMPSSTTRQLHLAYHNGDHYSSVRKLNDNTESPTNIRLKIGNDEAPTAQTHFPGHVEAEEGIVRVVRNTDRLAEEVMTATGCMDEAMVWECLADCDYDVDATIAYVFQTMETITNKAEDCTSLTSQVTSADSGVWSENGTMTTEHRRMDMNHNSVEGKGHHRDNSYGGSSGYGSVSSQNGGARPKLVSMDTGSGIKTESDQMIKLNSKQTKKLKKLEKKKRAEEKHRQKFLG